MNADTKILFDLNCADHMELAQRALFQDWLTINYGYPDSETRNALWDAFKRGCTIAVSKGGVAVL